MLNKRKFYFKEIRFINIKLNETRNIVENTLLEYERKYGFNFNRIVRVEFSAKFLDKSTNETKIIPFEFSKIIGKVNKIMQSSKGIFKFIRIVQLKIIIEGKIYKNLTDIYLRCENIPILWRKIFVRIANKRDNRLIRYSELYRERHFFNI